MSPELGPESPSGQYRIPSELTPETRLPLGWVVAIAGAVLTAGFVGGTVYTKFGSMDERLSAQERGYATILESLGELKGDVKELKSARALGPAPAPSARPRPNP